MGRPDDHQRCRELPGLCRGRARAGDDEGLPAPGGALRRRVRQRRRHARRLLGAAVPHLGGRGRVPLGSRDRRDRGERANWGSSPRSRCRGRGSPTARSATRRSSGSGTSSSSAATPRWRRRPSCEVRDEGDRRAPPRRVRASQIMEDRARANDKIEFITNAVVDEVIGEAGVTAVKIEDVNTGETHGAPRRRALRGDRSRPEHEALRGLARPRRRRLHRHQTAHRDEHRGRLRGSAMSSTTSTARRSRRPAWVAWARSTLNAGLLRARDTWKPRSRRPRVARTGRSRPP